MQLNNFIYMIRFTSKLTYKMFSFIKTDMIGVPWCSHRGKWGGIAVPGVQKLLTAYQQNLCFFFSALTWCLTLKCSLPCRNARSSAVCTYIISWVPSKTTSHNYQVRRSSAFFQIPLVGNPTSLQFCSNSVTHSFWLTLLTTKQKGPLK